MSRLFCEPNGKSWVLAWQVSERELKGLSVPLAHALDAVFVYVLPCLWISKRLEEWIELTTDEEHNLRFLNPRCQWPFRVSVVIKAAKTIFFTSSISRISTSLLPHAQLLLTEHSSVLLIFRVFVINKGCSLSTSTDSLGSFLLVEFPFSLTSLLIISFTLRCFVQTFLLIMVKFWYCFVVTAK